MNQLSISLLLSAALFMSQNTNNIPSFKVDPFWPKSLPNHWLVGAVAGVAVDSHDHVWIIHRPSTLQPNEVRASYRGAPPVLEFDREGTLVSSWGGPGKGYEWPQLEHGIYVDSKNNVWLAGAGEKDNQILKFTHDGKFLMQIGHSGRNRGSNDTENLVVQACRCSNDGFVNVCDRTNDRSQGFKKDGTFVREAFIAKETLGSGSVWDISFSPDRAQSFLIVPDGTNQVIRILRRESLDLV